MKKSLFLFFAACLLLTSCSTKISSVKPNLKDSNIHLNKELTSEIGQKMVDKYSVWVYEAIKVNNVPERITYYSRMLDLKSGDILVLKSETSKWKLFFKPNTPDGMAISKENSKIFPFSTGSGVLSVLKKANKNYQDITYEKTDYYSTLENSKVKNYSRQLFYNGKAGNTLKFTYREFIDDMARTAFTQDLQYDLSESNIIGFDGLRVEVIKATNTNITYKILSDFN